MALSQQLVMQLRLRSEGGMSSGLFRRNTSRRYVVVCLLWTVRHAAEAEEMGDSRVGVFMWCRMALAMRLWGCPQNGWWAKECIETLKMVHMGWEHRHAVAAVTWPLLCVARGDRGRAVCLERTCLQRGVTVGKVHGDAVLCLSLWGLSVKYRKGDPDVRYICIYLFTYCVCVRGGRERERERERGGVCVSLGCVCLCIWCVCKMCGVQGMYLCVSVVYSCV